MNWKKIGEGHSSKMIRLYMPKKGFMFDVVIGLEVQRTYEDGSVDKPMIQISTPSDNMQMFVPLDDYSHWCDIPDFDGEV